MKTIDFRFRLTLSAGTTSAASFVMLSPGSSVSADSAGGTVFHFNQ